MSSQEKIGGNLRDEARRQRNSEAARASRERKKTTEDNMRKMFDDNDRKIATLERTMAKLKAELKKPSPPP